MLLAADKVEYELSKWAVKERLAAHRLGRKLKTDLDPDDFPLSRTCSFHLNNAQGHLATPENPVYNSRDAKLRASRADSQESPKW